MYLRTGGFIIRIQSPIPSIAEGIALMYGDYSLEPAVEFVVELAGLAVELAVVGTLVGPVAGPVAAGEPVGLVGLAWPVGRLAVAGLAAMPAVVSVVAGCCLCAAVCWLVFQFSLSTFGS